MKAHNQHHSNMKAHKAKQCDHQPLQHEQQLAVLQLQVVSMQTYTDATVCSIELRKLRCDRHTLITLEQRPVHCIVNKAHVRTARDIRVTARSSANNSGYSGLSCTVHHQIGCI
eukprot:12273-Heterococcus_DN1.PRE.9